MTAEPRPFRNAWAARSDPAAAEKSAALDSPTIVAPAAPRAALHPRARFPAGSRDSPFQIRVVPEEVQQ